MPVTKVIDVDGDRLEVVYTPDHTCLLMLSKSEDPYNQHTIELHFEDTKAFASMIRQCLKWMEDDAR
jgi:hypothetical protein